MTSASYPGMSPYPAQGMYRPQGSRPGILTAVGVCSIVVASICLLAGMIGGLWAMGMYQTARVVSTQNSSQTAGASAAAPATVLPTPEELEAISAEQRTRRFKRRSGLIDLLHAVRPLSPEVRQQIDGILARYAERIIPADMLTASEVSSQQMRKEIDSIGTLPPVQAGDSEGLFFQFRETGRLEVYSNRAVFKPHDGSGALRSTGPATIAEEDAAVAEAARRAEAAKPAQDTPQQTQQMQAQSPGGSQGGTQGGPNVLHPSGLNESQVQSIVQKAQTASQGQLNPAQVRAITEALRSQTPPLVQSQMAYSPIRIALANPDGSAVVGFSNGTLMLEADGTVTNNFTNSMHDLTLDPIALTLMIGEAIAAMLLAVLLLVAGILALRSSPRAQMMHWIYALLKLPMAVLGAVVFAWVMQDLMTGVDRMSGGGGSGTSGPATFAFWIGLLGVIYPIALLVVFSTPSVRAFYAAERR